MLPVKIIPFALCAVLMSACSPTNNLTVKGVDLNTSTVGTETFLNMEAIVAMGNLSFPSVDVPIINPKTLTNLGQMSLQPLNDGTNRLTVSIDYEAATQLDPSLGLALPNQRELPNILNLTGATMVGIPVLQQSRIYVGGNSQKDLFLGAAIAVPAFDSVMSQLPFPLNIFFNFPFSSQISSVAGLFSGPQKGQNGIAVFVKRSAGQQAQKVMSFATRSADQPTIQQGGEELKHLTPVTLFKLDRLLNRHGTLKIK